MTHGGVRHAPEGIKTSKAKQWDRTILFSSWRIMNEPHPWSYPLLWVAALLKPWEPLIQTHSIGFPLSSSMELKLPHTSHSTHLLTVKPGLYWMHSSRLSYTWISFNACKAFFFLWGHLNSAWKPCLIIHCRGRQRVCQIHSKKAGTFFTAKQHKAVYWTNYTASARVAIPSPGVSAFTFLSWITSIAVCNDKYTLDKKKKKKPWIYQVRKIWL